MALRVLARRRLAVMYEAPLGALLAAAGHKGYALGFVCDLLGAAVGTINRLRGTNVPAASSLVVAAA